LDIQAEALVTSMNYNWDFSVIWRYKGALLQGLLVSLELTIFCIVVGTVLSIPIAIILSRQTGFLKTSVNFGVEIIRALPILVLLVWAYYVMPVLVGFSLSAFWVSAWVLAINLAAFAADILRGSIVAIPREHTEAAEALGMTHNLVLRRIVIPEMFRRSLPGLTAMYITMFKFSTLASVISVWELLHSSDTVISFTYKPLEVYTAIAIIYIALIIPATYLSKALERHPLFAISPEEAEWISPKTLA